MAAADDYANGFHRSFELRAGRSALVLVDLQRATASREHGLGSLLAARGEDARGRWRFDHLEHVALPAIHRLLEAYRRLDDLIVFVLLGSARDDYADVAPYLRPLMQATANRVGSPSHELLPGLEPRDGEVVVTKRTASAFLSTDLDARLRAAGVGQLVVAGVSTNSCVESTARDGADLGYDCVIAEDACSCASQALHRAALDSFGRLFGRVATTAEVLAELETGVG